jgi:hypothetical protein
MLHGTTVSLPACSLTSPSAKLPLPVHAPVAI